MFQLTEAEASNLIFQSGISSWGGKRKLPYAFTEHGIAMLSTTLRSERAVQTSVIRAFVRMREPVMVIGRLAVDEKFQGLRIGPGLLRDAVLRTLQAAEIAGIRAMLVHALSERARSFYVDCGFIASPVDPMTLMITLAEAAEAFLGKGGK